jgi:hypothetical protein
MAGAALPAMTPEIRLPEWQRSRIDISEWKPEQNLLTIRVDIEACNVQLENVSSQLHLPTELGSTSQKHERALLRKGDKVVFLHKVSVKPDFSGWAEVELKALPSQTEILQMIKEKHSKEPVTSAVLEAEALTIKEPLFFGRSMPLLVRDDIALCTAAETAFRPDYKASENEFYLWYPESGFGKGLTGEGLKAFSGAISTGNLKVAESAGGMLLKKLETAKEPLLLARDNNETFSIPSGVAIELIEADLMTLRAVINKDPASFETLVERMKPGYTKPFLMFNLASLFRSQNKNSKARDWYQKAAEEIPAWPLAHKHLKALGK